MIIRTKLMASIAVGLASVAITATSAAATTMPGASASHATAIHGQGRGQMILTGGEGAAVGIGALIIGGVVLSEAARAEHRRNHRDDWDRCAHSYPSFDRESGYYTDRDGGRHQCRYLN